MAGTVAGPSDKTDGSHRHASPGMFVRMGTTVAVAGASGYAGGELLRLLAGHPDLDVGPADGARQRRAAARRRAPAAGQPGRPGAGADRRRSRSPPPTSSCSRCRTASPAGWPRRCRADLPVVDLGADHRLADPRRLGVGLRRASTPAAGPTGCPSCPASAPRSRPSHRVAVTGCYAVAITLALAPLIAAGLVEPDDVVAVAASGTSGAGRAGKAHLLGSEVMGDLSPYKVGRHQHVPEIRQATGAPLAVVHAGPGADAARHPGHRHGPAGAAGRGRRGRAVRARGCVRVRSRSCTCCPTAGGRTPPRPLGSNSAHLQATVDADSGRVIVCSAIDNLGKGAAGQAVQCANLVLGLPETAGLSAGRGGPVSVTAAQGFRAAGVAAGIRSGSRPRPRARRQRRPARRGGRRAHQQPGQGRAGAVDPAGAGHRPAHRRRAQLRRRQRLHRQRRLRRHARHRRGRRRGARHRRDRRRGLLDRPDRRAAADGRGPAPASRRPPPRCPAPAATRPRRRS